MNIERETEAKMKCNRNEISENKEWNNMTKAKYRTYPRRKQ